MALSSELRSTLEKAIVAARDAAEVASRAALGVLAVGADRVPDHFDEDARRLRRALRAEARQVGGFDRLIEECAYEQWHRMLFARFLAENDLLIHPVHRVAVTLDECQEIAQERGETDLWLVASEFASTMLPGIFRPDDPVLQLKLAPEGQQRLERILAELPREVFTSEDGLGWVYQYWQTKKKKEVNASERKIGGADIAPVTQLFTESYMVRFLLENTLGAWWAARHPESPLVRQWEYLRFAEGGNPAAGSFPGWPDTVADVTVMDPCCGSGHFLVVAFEMLRQMRMEAEGLSDAEAGDAVLRDNLFGLELDPRCTQIAAFALALHAWKTGGYRGLPIPSIACSGISAQGRLEDWKKLAGGDERLERSLERLHTLFSDAGDLGSLIDPLRESDGDLLVGQFADTEPLFLRALEHEAAHDPSTAVFGRAAAGAARAAMLLARQYTLISTNVPYLTRGKQSELLMRYLERHYALSKSDLATAFVSRSSKFLRPDGACALVTPENWLYLTSYTGMRKELLQTISWRVVAPLGSGAFSEVTGEVVKPTLWIAQRRPPRAESIVTALDAASAKGTEEKREVLLRDDYLLLSQPAQLENPDHRIIIAAQSHFPLLSEFADGIHGLGTKDSLQFIRCFWEVAAVEDDWEFMQASVSEPHPWSGMEHIVFWQGGNGVLHERARRGEAILAGAQAHGRSGVLVSQVGNLACTLYWGGLFEKSAAAVCPSDEELLPALWAYCRSEDFRVAVRAIDRKLAVTNRTLVKVPFDVERWMRAGVESPPPAPRSNMATQWLFDGRPPESDSPLHVAIARLAGYRWPRQTGSKFPDCPVLDLDGFEPFADDDGIVCLPAIRGERPAADRLRALLAASFGDEWSPAKEADLLADVDYAGKSLEHWLRDGFFEQHCQLFHQRPFVWQIWDGRKDGLSALVNYHRLDRASLEKLIYTYLGEWIRLQREAASAATAGAELRLAAAQELQRKLELILEGEAPYEIFVRWKPLEEQPIGWEPDLNDGVRLNIRPFVTADVLRRNPNIKWGKDRGKDPESAPWYPVFKGDRINDHHLTLAEKRAAREAAARRPATS